MSSERWERPWWLWAILAGLVVLWGATGALQQLSGGRGGYSVGLGVVVNRVDEGGAAAAAALEVGDRILSVGGDPVDRPWSKPNLNSGAAGEVHSLIVERGGDTLEAKLVLEGLPRARVPSMTVDFLVTAAFVGFGLWAVLASGSSAGIVLALLGLCYGGANFPVPNLPFMDGAVRFVQLNFSFLATVFLFHFFMVFPVRKTVFRRQIPEWLLYVPFAPVVVVGLAEWLIFPALVAEYRQLISFTDLFYMVAALVALLHTAITLGPAGLKRTRFHLVLWGLVVAIGPFLILGLLALVLPDFAMPSNDYLPLLGIAIPGSMAWAVASS